MAVRQFSPFLFLLIGCWCFSPLFSAVVEEEEREYFAEEGWVPHQQVVPQRIRHRELWENDGPFLDVRPKKPKKKRIKKDFPLRASIEEEAVLPEPKVKPPAEKPQLKKTLSQPDWRALPNELWEEVFKYAGFRAAVKLSSTCREFNNRFGFLRAFVNGKGPGEVFNAHPSFFKSIWLGSPGYDAPILNLRSMFQTPESMDIFTAMVFNPRGGRRPLASALEQIRVLDLGCLPRGNVSQALAVLPFLPRLEELRLDHTRLQGAPLDTLSDFLKVRRGGLKTLHLHGCHLKDRGMDQLCRLGGAFQPKVLDLSHNQLRGNISRAVQQWFKEGGGLQELDMSENPVHPARQLVKVLKDAKRIKVLRLRGIPLSPSSVSHLFKERFAGSDVPLEELDLRGTGAKIKIDSLLKPFKNLAVARTLLLDSITLRVGGAFFFPPLTPDTARIEILKSKDNQHKIRVSGSLLAEERDDLISLRRPSIHHVEVWGEIPKLAIARIFSFKNASTLGLGKWISDDETMHQIARKVAHHPHLETLVLNAAFVSPRSAFKLMAFLKETVLEREEVTPVASGGQKKRTEKHVRWKKTERSYQQPLTIIFSRQLRPFEAHLNQQKPAYVTLGFWPPGSIQNF